MSYNDSIHNDTYSQGDFLCDGKRWDNANGVYCPEGPGHDCSRSKCSYFDSTDLSKTIYKKTNRYEYQCLQDLITNLHFTPYLSEVLYRSTMEEYSYKLSGYVNRLLSIMPHMHCKCGTLMKPIYDYSKKTTAVYSLTVFSCPNAKVFNDENHDQNVYLNRCYRCQRVIDSRECKIQDFNRYYLCMSCGGTEHIEPGTMCPNCGNEDEDFLHYDKRNKIISCDKCGHQVKGGQRESSHSRSSRIICI